MRAARCSPASDRRGAGRSGRRRPGLSSRATLAPLALGFAFASLAWAHLPSRERLSWYESVYQPQSTVLLLAAIVCLLVPTPRGRETCSPAASSRLTAALVLAALLLAALASAGSPDPTFALQYLAELVALGTVARWAHASRCSPAAMIAAVVLVILSLSSYAAGEVAGLVPSLSAPGLGPGATLGNRNTLARCAAMMLPGVWWISSLASGARRRRWIAAAVLLSTVVVVSRCRVAWLACLAGLAVALVLLATAQDLERRFRSARIATAGWIMLGTAACASLASRGMAWTDRAWFTSTAHRIVELSSGSGAVRVEQATALSALVARHPVIGLGPAPLIARGLSGSAGGYNTFASSDVMGFVVAFGILPVALMTIGIGLTLRRARLGAHPLRRIPVWATLAAILVCALGDTTLQLPVPGVIAVVSVVAWLPRDRAHIVARPPMFAAACRMATLLLLGAALASAGDQLIGAAAISYDLSLPRLPSSIRGRQRPSVRELRQAWDRAAGEIVRN